MSLFKKRPAKDSDAEMSFIEHIDELRKHLFKSIIAIVIGAIIMAYFNNILVKKVLMGPLHSDFPTYKFICKVGRLLGMGDKLCLAQLNVKMQSNAVSGQFNAYLNIILIGGFIIAFPYVFLQFWKFVKPALKSNELRGTRGVIFWVSLLFFIGVLFGYFLIAPYTINFFANFTLDDGIQNLWTIGSYFNTLVPLILGCGLAFQLPLVIFFLAKIGVANSSFLRKHRKYAIMIIVIAVSIITPPDMLSTIICSLPLLLLYEISIFLCVSVEKKQKKEEKNEVSVEWQ